MKQHSFNPKRDSFGFILAEAGRKGIRVSRFFPRNKQGRIAVPHFDWRQGLPVKKGLRFPNFGKAIRGYEHIAESISNRLELLPGIAAEFQSLQQLFLDKKVPSESKRNEALSQVLNLGSKFKGVRCATLLELKERLGGDESGVQTVEELADDKNWVAAACSVQKILLLVPKERQRLSKQRPKVLLTRDVLRKIWAHDLWLACGIRAKVVEFARLFDLAVPGQKGLCATIQEQLEEKAQAVLSYGDPYYARLEKVVEIVTSVLEKVRAGEFTSDSRSRLRVAQAILKQHEEWLRQDMEVTKN